MAVLPDADRKELWAELMQQLSNAGETISIKKTDLRAALDAADNWIDANAASYNAAIPQPARSALSPAQKALILSIVIARRFLKGA